MAYHHYIIALTTIPTGLSGTVVNCNTIEDDADTKKFVDKLYLYRLPKIIICYFSFILIFSPVVAEDRTAQVELYLFTVNHSAQTTTFNTEAASVIYKFSHDTIMVPTSEYQGGGLTVTGDDTSQMKGWKFEPYPEGATTWDTLGFGVYRFYTSNSYTDPHIFLDYTDCRYMRQSNPDPYTYKDLILKYDGSDSTFWWKPREFGEWSSMYNGETLENLGCIKCKWKSRRRLLSRFFYSN